MIKNFLKRIEVKNFIAIALTIVFCVLALLNKIPSDDFLSVFTIIISFYYGTQYERRE